MIKLNLATHTAEHDAIKEYLEENASKTLAEKINNGVMIEKDGKKLLNKKDLNGFMAYACSEAKKLVAKNASSACIKSDVVFGWAIHYFEEDSIEGKLYNGDGTEYKPAPIPSPKAVQRIPATPVPAKPILPKPKQFNFFDILSQSGTSQTEEPEQKEIKPCVEKPQDNNLAFDESNVDMETGEIISSQNEQPQGSPLYQKYMYFQNRNPQAVIAYRLGDFFEILGDNAIEISNRLNLTLTERNCGLDEPVLMIGFPYHACDKYFRQIAEFSQLIVVEGDVSTPYVLEEKTSNKISGTIETTSAFEDDLEKEREIQQYFDKDALCLLYELFDYKLDMQ